MPQVRVILTGIGILFTNFVRGEDIAGIDAARKVVDLSTFPAFGGEPKFEYRNVANQSYVALGYISEIARQVVDQLKSDGWSQVEGGILSDAFTSLDFKKNGFALSLNVSPDQRVNYAIIKLKNHGNVSFRDLPFAKDMALQHATSNLAVFHATGSTEEAKVSIRSKLIEGGWEEFGRFNEYDCYRKSAVRLMVSVRSAAALKGKTVIQVTSEQLWFDLPVPFPVSSLQCEDSAGKFEFTSEKTTAELVDFYEKELKDRGWIKEDNKNGSVDGWSRIQFRNQTGSQFGLAIAQDGTKSNVAGHVRSAEQAAIAEANASSSAAVEMQTIKAVDVIVVLPKHLKIESQSAKKVETSLGARGAPKASQAIQELLEASGWKVSSTSMDKDAGKTILSKDKARLIIEFSDPGLARAKLTISLESDSKLDVEIQK